MALSFLSTSISGPALGLTNVVWLEWMLVGFLLSLSLLHFFNYSFNQKTKSNFYFSIFSFFLAANRVVYVYQTYHFPALDQVPYLEILSQILNIMALMAAIYFIWIITSLKYYRLLYILLAIGLPLMFAVLSFELNPLVIQIISGYRLICYLFIMYALFWAMRHGQSGIWIVGLGTLLLMVTMLFFRFDVFSIWSGNPLLRVWLIIIGYLASLVLYSIYLAREQAKTTLRLDEQLEQVKTLSAENRQKDKYNQELLERQNTALEVLVKLRTEELTEKNAELEVQKNQILWQKEKLQELDALKSRFFANISHEFRTPLTLILDPLKKRLDSAPSPGDKLELSIMHRNAMHLLNLVNQLLDLSRLEAGLLQLRATPGNINAFIQYILSQFGSLAASKNISVDFCAEEEIEVYFDPEKLEKILLNLLGNAFKFTSTHSKITVGLKRQLPSSDYPLGFAEITVEDNGIGIAPEHLDKIFDRFYQADSSLQREFQGTGIGLALTKELVEMHKGQVKVSSIPGVGSQFRVELPLGKAHLQPDQIVPQSLLPTAASLFSNLDEEPDSHTSTGPEFRNNQDLVLVIEDNPDLRQFLELNLQPYFRIITTPDGETGLKAALQQIPDIIISDLMMPKLNGLELLQRLKKDEKTSHIPFILLTAKVDAETQLQTYQTGADAYLAKPFEMKELLVRVNNLLENRKMLQKKYSRQLNLQTGPFPVASADERFLKKAKEMVDAHLGDTGFGVGPMAREIGMSEVQLYRKLLALTGLNPNEFIRQMRLKRAADLLGQKAGNVGEVAYNVGFNNLSYFAKCFREAYGISPSKYKT